MQFMLPFFLGFLTCALFSILFYAWTNYRSERDRKRRAAIERQKQLLQNLFVQAAEKLREIGNIYQR